MKHENRNTNVNEICLGVFGALAASVTHELKNTLSIINENVGLLEDFGNMSDEGAGVPVKYVDDAAKTVTKQVERSNTILKNLNRFSHSGDTIPAQADIQDILTLMVALTSRFAAMRKISVTMACPESVTIRTNLLVLESLLFTTLRKVYTACPEGNVLNIQVDTDEARGVTVRFKLEGNCLIDSSQFPGLEEQTLAAEIDASCRSQEGELIIDLSACALQPEK